MRHSHLDLFADEPDWFEETWPGLPTDMPLDEEDEQTRLFMRIEAALPGAMYECGKSYRDHKEALLDVVRRHCEFDVIEPVHDASRGVHLGQATCCGCKSTFTWPMAGHAPRYER